MDELMSREQMAPQVQETFTLKHNGNLYEVGFDELVRLAQKGMDYDRIRKDRDECRQKIKMLQGRESVLQEEIMPDVEGTAEGMEYEPVRDWADEGKRKAFAELMRRYPEVIRYRHIEALPRGFVEGLESGLSPMEAWQEYLLARQQLKLAMLEREKANRTAAAPNARSNGRYEEDGFVKALFGR